MFAKPLAAVLVALTLVAVPVTADAPANDDRADATAINTTPFTDTLHTGQATVENGEPQKNCGPNWLGATVWYEFTPLSPAPVSVNTTGSDFDTILAVYVEGEGGLERVACNDDIDPPAVRQSALTFNPEPLTKYYIQAGGYTTWYPLPADTGNLVVNVDQEHVGYAAGAVDDAKAFAEYCAYSAAGGNYFPCLPDAAEDVVNEVWYQLPPEARDAVNGAYQTAGDAIDTVGDKSPPPVNDNFAMALPATAGVTLVENTGGATSQVGEALRACGTFGSIGATVWFAYTATADGPASINTDGSDFDAVLSVYEGESLEDLDRIACDDDSGSTYGAADVTFEATAGTTYYVQASGFQVWIFPPATGNLVINFEAPDLPL